MRQPVALLLRELCERPVRGVRQHVLDARRRLRVRRRLLRYRDLRGRRVPRVDVSAGRRCLQRHERLLHRSVRRGPVPSRGVHGLGGDVHDGLRVLRGGLRRDGHLSGAVPNGERAVRTSDRVLYRIDVFHGLVPQPEHVSADERRLYQSDAVLLGALHQWPLRRDELRHDERAVSDDVELLLVSVHQRQVPVTASR